MRFGWRVGARLPHFVGLALVFSVVGCSSSSSGSSYMECQNPNADEQSCFSCISASCSSQVQAYEAACSTYLACESACDCDDSACLGKCGGGAQGTEPCGNATVVTNFFACEATCKVCTTSGAPKGRSR
jgi:hypothetical protein